MQVFYCLYGHCQKTEPVTSATPQLSSLLHSYFVKNQPASTTTAGTRRIKVPPTAIARRREGIARGSQYAPSGRPPKRKTSAEDCQTQTKRGKQDYTKRKHSLSLNVHEIKSAKPFQTWAGTLTYSYTHLQPNTLYMRMFSFTFLMY